MNSASLRASESYRREANNPLLPLGPTTTGSNKKISNRTLATSLIIIVALIVSALLVFIFVIFVNNKHNDDSQIVGQTVTTSYGKIRGFNYNVTTWNGQVLTVKAWRGVPFATPPVGELRWKPPEPPATWTGTLNCTEFKPPCIQPSGEGSEDCLYLNIYASVTATDPGPWPVYFDIYGGGLMGGAATANYNGLIYSSATTQEGKGLVVVAPAYRLNIFGFLATEQLTEEQNGTSGNYGIQDQIAALQWVKQNIAGFNGDPNNVIIGGFSSGGTSVFGLLSSPKTQGLYAAAMSYSGSTNITIDLPAANLQNAPIVNSSGCNVPTYTYEQVNTCMRNLSIKALVDLIPHSWRTPGLWGLPASPDGQDYAGIIIVDGTIITQPFATALAKGIVDVPFLFGNMGMEPDESPDEYVGDYNNSQWYQLLNQTFSTWPDSRTVTNRIYALYSNDSTENPQKAYDRIVADYGLYCSQIVLAKNALPPTGQRSSPIYIYYDEWHLSKVFIGGSGHPVRYAYHGLFYTQLTDQWNLIGNGSYLPTSEDLAAQQAIQSNIWNFFLTHQPTSSWSAVNAVSDWPNSYSLYDLEYSTSSSKTNYRSEICDYYATIGLIKPEFWWCD